jgi:hypothetical protein
VVEEKDSRDATVTEYFVNPGSMLGNVMGVKKDGVWYYPTYDAMGTVWQVVESPQSPWIPLASLSSFVMVRWRAMNLGVGPEGAGNVSELALSAL